MNPAETYILKQPEPYKSILLQLQSIVESVAPNSELLFKWKLPFYYNNGIPLCYFNQSKDYVDLAFWHGEHFEKFKENYVSENRKTVMSLRYRSVEDIDDEVVVYVIQQLLAINTNPFKLILKPNRSKK